MAKRMSRRSASATARSLKKRAAKDCFAATAAHGARNRRVHGLQPWLHSFAAPRLKSSIQKNALVAAWPPSVFVSFRVLLVFRSLLFGKALLIYRTEHGVGSHPFAVSGSFLKCELVMNGPVKYSGSSTMVVTIM